MFLRKVTIAGIKGIQEPLVLDLSPKARKEWSDNVEYFGLENAEHKNKFSALKQAAIIGPNASGKTSILFGVIIGMGLLSDPISNMQNLSAFANIYYEDDFMWKYEIVGGSKKDGKVRKYLIEFKYAGGIFTEEKVTFSCADEKSISKDEVLYELNSEQRNIKIQGKVLNHNPQFSLFAAVRMGNYNPILSEFVQEHYELFTAFEIFTDFAEQQPFPFPFGGQSIYVPRNNEKLYKTYMKMLKLFDSSIEDVKINNMGRTIFKVKGIHGEVKEVPAEMMENLLSTGTKKFLKRARTILRSMIRDARGVYLFDEFDSEIHYGLFSFFVELMRMQKKSQFIFTTHSSEIFKMNLRDDQIIQVQKKDSKIKIQRASDLKMNTREKTANKFINELMAKPNNKEIMEVLIEIMGENA